MRWLLLSALLILGPAPSGAAAANPDGVAVIIGNKTYQGRIPAVDYAHNDAEAIKRYVVDVLGYREGNIIDLRDATQAQLLSAFGNETTHEGKVWQYVRPGKSDVAVFYSGHGVPGQRDKRGYLLPVDADPNTPEINGYSIDLLYKNLSKIDTKSTTVFLDTCFSGDSARGMLIGSASPIFIEAKTPAMAKGMTVLTAAQGDQLASWDDDAKHGLFTEHLLQALYGKADGNGDGKVSVKEVKAYLDQEMTYAARRRFSRHQQATILGNTDRVLASYSPGKPPVRPKIKVAKEAPRPALGSNAAELAFWDAIKDSTNSADFEDYLAQFPHGTFSRLAKRRAGEHRKPQVAVVTPPRPKFAPVPAPSPAKPAVGVYPERHKPGDVFKDCAECPEMVVIPAGSFRMGDLQGGGEEIEKPVHRVTIPRPFAVGKYEVTQADYQALMGTNPSNFKGERKPVENVTWTDAKEFARKLSARTGKKYRLLSESEWEYAARAGSFTKYPWGNSINPSQAKYHSRDGTVPVGTHAPNAFGVYDTVGSVWEWTEGCWHGSYNGAPTDGSAWTSGGECGRRVIRGGSWLVKPWFLRSAVRHGYVTVNRDRTIGFRVARTF